MKRSRGVYAVLISLIILLGILFRRISIIPLSAGDVLWAMMIFFIVRFMLINAKIGLIALIGLSLCYLVEISQLYQEEWIVGVRQTILGRLVLGQGFLWSDFLAYAAGVLIGFSIEVAFAKGALDLPKS